MIRFLAFCLSGIAVMIFAVVVREERLAAGGKVPMGRLRRFWPKAERRRFPRYRVDWPIRYRRIPGNHAPAKTRDVSQTGVGLLLQEKLEAGTHVELELTLSGQEKPVIAFAEIVWSKEVSSREGSGGVRNFFTGLRFKGMDPAVEKRLGMMLKSAGLPPLPETP
ncbi:MAG: PilZ domain-containing protein [Candidatus Omnitrophica bacterium]|nr:PilZ domain-containing protein [Candidatus Omnitrophota bacterium]